MNKKAKTKNKMMRLFIIDSIGTAIFWTIVYIPIYLYTSKTLYYAFVGLALAALVEVAFGGLFGRYLDKFRSMLLK